MQEKASNLNGGKQPSTFQEIDLDMKQPFECLALLEQTLSVFVPLTLHPEGPSTTWKAGYFHFPKQPVEEISTVFYGQPPAAQCHAPAELNC